MAEYLGGSEENSPHMMTAQGPPDRHGRATMFRNASGLPDPDQRTTARDMALLGVALQQRFPEPVHLFLGPRFHLPRPAGARPQRACSGACQGVDGIKTGYIRASGYNIVTSVNARGGASWWSW